ncbi:MAG: BMP family ABC transporter substrate-binding protein [Oscillospiraceae bacterium]|nr:BMP family ABC transporter substrate-binding protein [Oscillospiraceae bacterium]
MKKLLALVLAGVMALSLVACGGGEAEGTTESGEELLKVNLIVQNLGDKSFNDSADSGLKRLVAEGKIDYTCTEYGTDNSKVVITMEEAAEDYDVVICNNLGFGMATDWLAANAASYPETTFIIYDEPSVSLPDKNVQFLCYKANESDYVAGALAALISETGVIGFVGGMESPVIHDFLVGYILGAQYVNPDVKVCVSYVGSYTDAAKAKDLGVQDIAAGADVLHQVAGSAGNGYLEAAFEAGKYGLGVDADQYEAFKESKPELAKSIVTSSLKDVGESLYVVVGDMVDGTYEWAEQLWFGMPEKCAGIAENENYLALVSEEDRATIDDIKAKMAAGEITVPTAYGMTADEINALVDSAK